MTEMAELEVLDWFIISSRFVLGSDNSREITVLECGLDDDDSDGSDAVSTPSDSQYSCQFASGGGVEYGDCT